MLNELHGCKFQCHDKSCFVKLPILNASVKTPKADANNRMHCLLGSQEKLSSSVLKDNFFFNLSAYHSDDDSWLTVC